MNRKIIAILCLIPIVSSAKIKSHYSSHNNSHSHVEQKSSDVPLIIKSPKVASEESIVFFISGDGGWNSFDQAFSDECVKLGYHVVGLNALKYFWQKKTPQEAANKIAQVLNEYLMLFKKDKIILCGYSFGADVLPFIYTRLPSQLKNQVVKLKMLSPASFTDFEIHISDLLGSKNSLRSMQVASELHKINIPIVCFYGSEEELKPLAKYKAPNFSVSIVQGDHHYEQNLLEIVKR
ncbi:MAG: hypothetical protein JWQ25_1245 [Daejeonella sp.]|nr:hypothetical protein [Daejeonella sp.]